VAAPAVLALANWRYSFPIKGASSLQKEEAPFLTKVKAVQVLRGYAYGIIILLKEGATMEAHDLLHEFPNHKETIHELKMRDNHFSRLFDEYHRFDRELHRIDAGIETPSDAYVEDLKKKRLFLKDQLFEMIQAAA
jgi:uncharacterized protein YdcH (DUF465 family)